MNWPAMGYKRKYANTGAVGSRMTAYGGQDRAERFHNSRNVRPRRPWSIKHHKQGYGKTFRRSNAQRPRRKFRYKKRKGRGGARTYGSAGDSSSVSLGALGKRRRFLGRVEKALASKSVYEVLGSVRVTSAVNLQGTSYIPLFFSDEIRACFANSTGATPNEGGKVYLQSGVLRAQMVNQTNVPCTVWLYDIVLRRDTNDALAPDNDWGAGITAEGGAATDFRLPYSTPFKSSRFCTKWRVRKVSKLMLAPGEEHTHTLRVSPYNYVPQTRIYDVGSSVSTGFYGVGSLSHMLGVVILGGVINDNTTKTNVGYSAVSLDIAFTKSYRTAALFDDKRRYAKVSTLPAITTGSTMVEVDADPSVIIDA